MIPSLSAAQNGDYEPYEPYEPATTPPSNIPQGVLAASAAGCPFVNFNGISFQGSADANSISGTRRNDLIRGGGANDYITGFRGDDCLFGQSHGDTMLGGRGKDTMRGNAGNDSMFGSRGRDNMRGNSGDDMLVGGRGRLDRMSGGSGDDFLKPSDGRQDLRTRCGRGFDVVRIDPFDPVSRSCEVVQVVRIITR